MTRLVLDIEGKEEIDQIKKLAKSLNIISIKEYSNNDETLGFDEESFRSTLKEIKNGEAFENSKAVSDLFQKLKND